MQLLLKNKIRIISTAMVYSAALYLPRSIRL